MLRLDKITLVIVLAISTSGCDAKRIQPEPPLANPAPSELTLANVRSEVFDLADKIEELQAMQTILVDDLVGQKRPINEDLFQRLKANSGVTLQWIESETRGKVSVSKSQTGDVLLRGEQVSDDGRDKLLVEGQVVLMTPTAFMLKGVIDFDVQSLRESGQPRCRREGIFTFRITGNRKYWRLLEKTGHCGMTTDYVDIYL